MRPDAAVLFAVILYLGVRAGKRIPRAELLELIWTDVADPARRHSLRQIVYRLKRAGLELDLDGDDLCVEPDRVRCDLSAVLGDGWPATVAITDIPNPADILPFYQPGLTPAYAEWVDRLRSDAGAQIRRATLRHIDVARREGRWQDVELLARTCLATDPLNEEGTLALAEATAMGGSKAEALRILDGFLWEIGTRDESIRVPAKLLRRRISDQPSFRVPRAGDGPLIARTQELAWLNSRLDQAGSGAACTAMLLGPPGIGKTAVARAFTAHAEMRGWRPITSRLQPSDMDRPMSVFTELLPTLLKSEGAIGAAPESIAQLRRLIEHRTEDDILSGKSQEAEAIQARIRASMQDLLSALSHEGPLILLLEDLHWIDHQSLRLLTWIVEHAPGLPVMWLMTARLESRIAELRAAFAEDRTPSRVIEPLDREEATLLFQSIAGSETVEGAARVAEDSFPVTGGNPLFVREVARHWTETGNGEALPSNLRVLMRGRVARLSPPAQRVLHCCALLGRYATVPRVGSVLEASTAELYGCIAEVDELGISGVEGEPGSLVLHDLWQEELANQMRPAPRALLHHRCGEVLLGEGHRSKEAGVVSEAARHLVHGGAPDRAVIALEDAAAHYQANGMHDDAIASLDTALTLAVDDGARFRICVTRIASLRAIGAWPEIQTSLNGALGAERRLSPTVAEHTNLELIETEASIFATGDLSLTVARAKRCVLATHADSEHRAEAAWMGARAAANLFDAAELSFFFEQAELLDRRRSSVAARALRVRLIYNTECGDLAIALASAADLVTTERDTGSVVGYCHALRNLTVPLRVIGAFERAADASADAFAHAARHHLVNEAAAAADVVAWTYFEAGELTRSEEWISVAAPWVRQIEAPHARASMDILRAMIDLEAQSPSLNREFVERATHGAENEPIIRQRLYYIATLARFAAARGDIALCRLCADRLGDWLWKARGFRRTDYFVSGLAIALCAIGKSKDARDALAAFAPPVPYHAAKMSRFVAAATKLL
ncbi:MAG: AAA family ATPase [Gemmatimonadota bacterium]|nr:AAA family ATPase [Gemmatimonadota bacterium]